MLSDDARGKREAAAARYVITQSAWERYFKNWFAAYYVWLLAEWSG